MRILVLLVAVFLLLNGCASTSAKNDKDPSNTANSSIRPIEEWHCKELYGNSTKVLVSLKVFDEFIDADELGPIQLGEVEFDNDTFIAAYENKGFKQSWVFLDDANHQVRLKVNGRAHYFDFTGAKPGETRESEMTLDCQKQ